MSKDLSFGKVLDLDMETLQDYSGNSHTVTATDVSLTTDEDGRYNQARIFNGSSSKISLGDIFNPSNGDEISWFGVVKPSSSPNNSTFIGAGYKGMLGVFTDKITFAYYPGTDDIYTANIDLTDNVYNRVLVTYTYGTGSSIKIYLNGTLLTGAWAYGTGNDAPPTSTQPLQIGQSTQYLTSYFPGDISKIIMWDRALSAEEAKQLDSDVKHNYSGLFDSLVAGYDFKGDAKDFSGNGYDGTIIGATPTSDQFGIDNSAYSCNGSTNYINIGDNVEPSLITARVKFNAVSTPTSMLIDKGGHAGYGYIIAIYSNKIEATVWTAGGSQYRRVYSTTTLSTGTIYDCVMTWDGTTLLIYLNGVDDTNTGSYVGSGSGNIVYNSAKLFIGGRDGTLYPFDGIIYEVGIYDNVKSSDIIKTLHDLSKVGYIYPYPQENLGGITQ